MNKTTLLLIAAMLGLSVQGFSQWNYLGLSHFECSEIQVIENTIYVGTEQGMYTKPVQSSDTLWTPIGLQDRPVNDFIIFSQDTLLVATELFVYPEDSISLYITYDGGLNWLPYQNGFGGAYPKCNEIKHDPIQPNILFGVSGAAVARSMDRGLSWELIYADWGMAAMYHIFLLDYSSGEIWVGGQTGYFENRIIRFTEYGDQYEMMDPVPNSTSRCMVKHPEISDNLLAGGSGGIFSSIDNGETWEPCEVIGDLITDMGISPQNSNVVYASGFYSDYASFRLFCSISTNYGTSWNSIFHNDITHDYFANSLEVYQGQSYDNIFIATNRGVYVYTNMNLNNSNIIDESRIEIRPNPFVEDVFVNTSQKIKNISLYDLNGKIWNVDYNSHAEEKSCKLNLAELPAGIYLIFIEQNDRNYSGKLIKN